MNIARTGSRRALALGTLLLGTAFVMAAGAQTAPSTDIWLAQLDLESSPPTVSGAFNATNREGYDNQPFFEPEGGGLLYTSQRDGQTDIYRLKLDGMVVTQLTTTSESEYSPTVTPGGLLMSVIRVESDGTQRLWSFRRDGSSPELVVSDVAPVGYHAWTQDDGLAMFVLGEPATLQVRAAAGDDVVTAASDIGRSLHPLPDGSGISFLHRVDGAWRIRALALASGEITDLGAPFEDSQDMAWTPDGRIVMAAGSRVAIRSITGDWTVIGDLEADGATALTRVAVHADGTRLAVVASR
jgi:hypothetical protein